MCVQLEQSCCGFKAHLLLCWQETPLGNPYLFSLPLHTPTPHTVGRANSKGQILHTYCHGASPLARAVPDPVSHSSKPRDPGLLL